ncbi:crossover junction endodeoxyribonuclease RuvC [Novosphingobium sediminicola]|uniref:Crossover junction endodeoxyribonuclease RuvC n=1 Tax=Novosphingobium sediminicola TaxID=563162 RepID=A0A7W6G863_9SPHN|nr:crossover junction endodeoxyribonuclease RuvC [Novosphingobium sediminicola]MBB3956981.1 crossover junction endodeoxyribonuclease RuvC [Novosphingobium sediminicola]
MIILGIDPGLVCTGWGIVAKSGSRISHVANGQIRTDKEASMASRLLELDTTIARVIEIYKPDFGVVEEIFVNVNPQSTLKLGQARGAALLSLARAGLPVSEYPSKVVKKALVGTGGAAKEQVQHMLKVLLPGVKLAGADAADALAVAITHAHHVGAHL